MDLRTLSIPPKTTPKIIFKKNEYNNRKTNPNLQHSVRIRKVIRQIHDVVVVTKRQVECRRIVALALRTTRGGRASRVVVLVVADVLAFPGPAWMTLHGFADGVYDRLHT